MDFTPWAEMSAGTVGAQLMDLENEELALLNVTTNSSTNEQTLTVNGDIEIDGGDVSIMRAYTSGTTQKTALGLVRISDDNLSLDIYGVGDEATTAKKIALHDDLLIHDSLTISGKLKINAAATQNTDLAWIGGFVEVTPTAAATDFSITTSDVWYGYSHSSTGITVTINQPGLYLLLGTVIFGASGTLTTSYAGASINKGSYLANFDSNADTAIIPATALPDGSAVQVERIVYVTAATSAAPVYYSLYGKVKYTSGTFTIKKTSRLGCVRLA